MPKHSEKRVLLHTARQMYDLVADVEAYPDFLPWCVGARIFKREENVFYADMMIGYKLFREKFTSKVVLDEGRKIDVTYLTGPMKYLHNNWGFEDNVGGGCTISFHIDFEIRNRIFQSVMGPVFSEAVMRMVHAFETRADAIYGSDQRLHQL